MNEDYFTMLTSNGISKKDANCIDSLPLAMAYVPMQKWYEVYSTDVALERGTIFPDLDKPFLGRRPIDD